MAYVGAFVRHINDPELCLITGKISEGNRVRLLRWSNGAPRTAKEQEVTVIPVPEAVAELRKMIVAVTPPGHFAGWDAQDELVTAAYAYISSVEPEQSPTLDGSQHPGRTPAQHPGQRSKQPPGSLPKPDPANLVAVPPSGNAHSGNARSGSAYLANAHSANSSGNSTSRKSPSRHRIPLHTRSPSDPVTSAHRQLFIREAVTAEVLASNLIEDEQGNVVVLGTKVDLLRLIQIYCATAGVEAPTDSLALRRIRDVTSFLTKLKLQPNQLQQSQPQPNQPQQRQNPQSQNPQNQTSQNQPAQDQEALALKSAGTNGESSKNSEAFMRTHTYPPRRFILDGEDMGS